MVKAVARIGGKPLAPKTDLLLLPVCGIIADMKPFVKVLAFCGLLIVIASCEAGKSGPFTFTNSTGKEVSVIITQDKTVEKKFSDQEKYVGEDYFSPTITFVKGIDSTDDKEIINNTVVATTANGFDYEFEKQDGQKLVISANLGGDYSTNEATKDDGCYVKEADGKLGEDSSTTVKLADITAPPPPTNDYKLYTSTPEFRIYNGSNQDVTHLFGLALGQESLPPADDVAPPTVQWNLVITYPKVELVD